MSASREIIPVNKPINAAVTAPGSKSITNRALLLAAMADGESVLNNALFSDDTRAMVECLSKLGFDIEADIKTCSIRITGGVPKNAEVNVRNAGTAARFMAAYLAANNGDFTLTAGEQMKRRPMETLFNALTGLGADIRYMEKGGCLPVRIAGKQLAGGDVTIAADQSSQFISALLMTAVLYKNGLRVIPEGFFTSKSYITITTNMMRSFGVSVRQDGDTYIINGGQTYKPQIYDIEPDVSGACYFYAAACLTGGSALVRGVYPDSMQGDLRFLYILRDMGCTVTEEPEGMRVTAPADRVYRGVDVNLNGCSDQTMTLAALAPFAASETVIRGISHIRRQECDRIAAIINELTKMGIKCGELPDGGGIFIKPGTPRPAEIETYNDHRVAMSFALIGLKISGVKIINPACTAKTFENYFDVLDAVAASGG